MINFDFHCVLLDCIESEEHCAQTGGLQMRYDEALIEERGESEKGTGDWGGGGGGGRRGEEMRLEGRDTY